MKRGSKRHLGRHNFGDVAGLDALALEQASIAAGVTRFQRPGDGAWDPRTRHRDDFYFVSTASLTLNCRLWRLCFDDVEHPEHGGTIEILLKGTEGHGMLDNVTIDRLGRIVMDEDPGNNARVSKVWVYQIATGEFLEVAHHNPTFFDSSLVEQPGVHHGGRRVVGDHRCRPHLRARLVPARRSGSQGEHRSRAGRRRPASRPVHRSGHCRAGRGRAGSRPRARGRRRFRQRRNLGRPPKSWQAA